MLRVRAAVYFVGHRAGQGSVLTAEGHCGRGRERKGQQMTEALAVQGGGV